MGVRRTGYPQELFDVAESLLKIEPHTEAIARRTISTAYYALFHLLIEGACELWSVPAHRARIARHFDHKQMRLISVQAARQHRENPEAARAGLALVASTFVQLQQARHEADYKLSDEVERPEAELSVLFVREAFSVWNSIDQTPVAQDYLLSLLFRERES